MKKPTLFGVLLGLAVTSCAQTQPSSALPAPNAQGEYTPGWPDLGRGEARFITIQLGPDTYAYCHDVSPKFPFDSSLTYVQHADQLQALASCLNHDVMQSRHVLLVGRADPRGTDAYNLGLGERRAQQIKELLIKNGLDADRIDISTEGARDAKGQLPDFSFGYDRRVDVVVTGGAHAP